MPVISVLLCCSLPVPRSATIDRPNSRLFYSLHAPALPISVSERRKRPPVDDSLDRLYLPLFQFRRIGARHRVLSFEQAIVSRGLRDFEMDATLQITRLSKKLELVVQAAISARVFALENAQDVRKGLLRTHDQVLILDKLDTVRCFLMESKKLARKGIPLRHKAPNAPGVVRLAGSGMVVADAQHPVEDVFYDYNDHRALAAAAGSSAAIGVVVSRNIIQLGQVRNLYY